MKNLFIALSICSLLGLSACAHYGHHSCGNCETKKSCDKSECKDMKECCKGKKEGCDLKNEPKKEETKK